MDTIGDMLTRIRNGLMARKEAVDVLYSKQNLGVLKVLLAEGYISEYKEEDIKVGIKKIIVTLKYYNGEPVIKKIRRVSKPSVRSYSTIADLPSVFNGLGISVLSTSKGIMSNIEAKKQNVGGEVICTVF